MTATAPTAELWFAGKPSRAHSLIVPGNADAPGSVFVLEHRRDGENLHIFYLEGGDTGEKRPMPISVTFPAALVRDLLDRRPEVPEADPAQAHTAAHGDRA